MYWPFSVTKSNILSYCSLVICSGLSVSKSEIFSVIVAWAYVLAYDQATITENISLWEGGYCGQLERPLKSQHIAWCSTSLVSCLIRSSQSEIFSVIVASMVLKGTKIRAIYNNSF